MTLHIEVKLNNRVIARASASNISNLAPVSSYEVTATESASPVTGLPAREETFTIEGHEREQSVWALVGEIASCMSSPAILEEERGC